MWTHRGRTKKTTIKCVLLGMEQQPMMFFFFVVATTKYLTVKSLENVNMKKEPKSKIKTHHKTLSGGKKKNAVVFLFVFPRIYPKILHLRAYFTYTVYKINIISLSTLRQCSMRIPTNSTDIHMPWISIVANFLLSSCCWLSRSSSVPFSVCMSLGPQKRIISRVPLSPV